jgi:uncharacterized protein (TIGR00266 family)
MQYRVVGQTVPCVEMLLNNGEGVYTQSGGMAYQSDGIDMKTNTNGGIGKAFGRLFAGESMFMATYTSMRDNATIAFSSTVPGNIVPINMAEHPQGMILQKGAFLCAQPTVTTQVTFTKKFSAGLFGGEGFILQQATGSGMLFLEVDGDTIERTLQPGEILKVNTGNVVAFDPSVKYEIEMVQGFSNIFLGGEGLFLTKLTGPGKVVLQTQNFQDFAGRIKPYVQVKSN